MRGAVVRHAYHGASKGSVGKAVDMLSELRAELNFTIQNVKPRDKKWAGKFTNGSYKGLVGMLVDDDIDVTAGMTDRNMMVTMDRYAVVDYLWPSELVKITLLAGKSSKNRLDTWAYVNVFPKTAWLIGLIFLLVSAVVFSVSSQERISNAFALMVRLFLQLG